jgi:hypothetical protein
MKTQITKTVLLFVAMVMMQTSFAQFGGSPFPKSVQPFFKKMLEKKYDNTTKVTTEALISIMSTKKSEDQNGHYYNAFIGPMSSLSGRTIFDDSNVFVYKIPNLYTQNKYTPTLYLKSKIAFSDRFANSVYEYPVDRGYQPFSDKGLEDVEVSINTNNYDVTVKIVSWNYTKVYKCQPKNSNILYGFSTDGDMISISFGNSNPDGGYDR